MSRNLLDRIVDILESFDEEHRELGVTGVSQRTGLPKGTVHRILKGLTSRGLLHKETETDRYSLGPKLLALAGRAYPGSELIQVADGVMLQLRDEFEETVLLSLKAGMHEHFTVHQVESHHLLRNVAEIGKARPLHLGCSGRGILAFLPPSEVDAVLDSVEEVDTASGHRLSADAIRSDLDRIAARGYADTSEEYTKGASGIAVPIFNHSGSCFASLYIVGPKERFTAAEKQACLPMLQQAGESLSRRCGFEGAYPGTGAGSAGNPDSLAPRRG